MKSFFEFVNFNIHIRAYFSKIKSQTFKISFLLVLSVVSNTFIIGQTTYKDVAPIFYNECTSCHNNVSHAASLLNYSATSPYVSTIQNYLTTNYMPPWLPDTTYTRFVHEHHVTTSEKNAILNWIASGALKGDTTVIAPPPVYTRYQINATPDLELTIPVFTSNASTTDSYICFALPTGLTQDRIIRALEIVPGTPSIVHHVIANVDTTGTDTSNLSGNCFTLPGDFMIGAAASGSQPIIFPSQIPYRMGVRLKAGSNIMLQVHYPAGSAGIQDSTKIRLYFYPVGTTNIRTVYTKFLLRNNILKIPANTIQTFTAQCTQQSKISVFAVFPHSHYLATQIVNYAYKANDTIPLIRINNWDFDFQGIYTYRYMPIILPGYNLFGQHVYDNTSNNPNNPSSPPIYVAAGENSLDEMFKDGYQWVTYQEGDESINIDSLIKNDPLMSSINQNKGIRNMQSNAYPNPFQSDVNIEYELAYPCKVSIEIYAASGTHVRTLTTDYESTGLHEVVWDGKSNEGSNLASGNYFYTIKAGENRSYGKLSLLSK